MAKGDKERLEQLPTKPGWPSQEFRAVYGYPEIKLEKVEISVPLPPAEELPILVPRGRQVSIKELEIIGKGGSIDLDSEAGWIVAHWVFGEMADRIEDLRRWRGQADLEAAVMATALVDQSIGLVPDVQGTVLFTHPLYVLAEKQGNEPSRALSLALLLFQLGFEEEEGVVLCQTSGEFGVMFGDSSGFPGIYPPYKGRDRFWAGLGRNGDAGDFEVGELPDRFSRLLIRPLCSFEKVFCG